MRLGVLALALMACGGGATATSPGATLVVTATPNADQMASVKSYLGGVAPLLKQAGGQNIRRLKTDHVVDGRPSGMVLVAEFDSADAAKELFESREYRALIPQRDKGFAEVNILVTHDMNGG